MKWSFEMIRTKSYENVLQFVSVIKNMQPIFSCTRCVVVRL